MQECWMEYTLILSNWCYITIRKGWEVAQPEVSFSSWVGSHRRWSRRSRVQAGWQIPAWVCSIPICRRRSRKATFSSCFASRGTCWWKSTSFCRGRGVRRVHSSDYRHASQSSEVSFPQACAPATPQSGCSINSSRQINWKGEIIYKYIQKKLHRMPNKEKIWLIMKKNKKKR